MSTTDLNAFTERLGIVARKFPAAPALHMLESISEG